EKQDAPAEQRPEPSSRWRRCQRRGPAMSRPIHSKAVAPRRGRRLPVKHNSVNQILISGFNCGGCISTLGLAQDKARFKSEKKSVEKGDRYGCAYEVVVHS